MISIKARRVLEWCEEDEDEPTNSPTMLVEVDTNLVSVEAVPGPPRVPTLGRPMKAVSVMPCAFELELDTPSLIVPLTLARASLMAPRVSRRPTVRAPLTTSDRCTARPSLQPTVRPPMSATTISPSF